MRVKWEVVALFTVCIVGFELRFIHGATDASDSLDYQAMVLDGLVSSPLRRQQYCLKKQWEELGSCSTVIQRHRYLLTALAFLAFLCTVYLYFVVTLGARHSSCHGLTGKEKAMCQLQHVQAISKGKLKFF